MLKIKTCQQNYARRVVRQSERIVRIRNNCSLFLEIAFPNKLFSKVKEALELEVCGYYQINRKWSPSNSFVL